MKKLLVVLGVGLGGLVVLVAAVLIAVFVFIDAIAKRGIEEGATYALEVPTTLDSADVGLLSGRFDMDGLTISNPQGFSSPHFLSMNDGGVAVTLASLGEDTVVLPELVLSGIDMNLQRAEGRSNYAVLLESLKRLESGEKTEAPPNPNPKKFIVNKIELRDISVHLDLLPIAGDATKLDIDIPEITLEDVGSAGDGVPVRELTSIILKALLTAVMQKAGGIVPGDLLGDLRGNLSQLTSLSNMGIDFDPELINSTFEDLGGTLQGAANDAINNARDQAEDAVNDATDRVRDGVQQGLDNLFGRPRNNDAEEEDTDDNGDGG